MVWVSLFSEVAAIQYTGKSQAMAMITVKRVQTIPGIEKRWFFIAA